MDKREEMLLLMEEFGNSGLSQKEFSTAKGMPFHRFNYWYRKLKKKMRNLPVLYEWIPVNRMSFPWDSLNWNIQTG